MARIRLGELQVSGLEVYVFDPVVIEGNAFFEEPQFPGHMHGSTLYVSDPELAWRIVSDASNSADDDHWPEVRDALHRLSRRIIGMTYRKNRPGGGQAWGRRYRPNSDYKWLLPLAAASAALTLLVGYLASFKRSGQFEFGLPETPPWVKAGGRVLLIGSSSALGLQAPFTALCKGIGAEVVTRGRNGSTAVGWSSTIASEVASGRPDTVVVILGGNDSATTYPPERHAAAIDAFVKSAANGGANLYWVLPFALPWADNFSPLVRAAGIRVFETPKAGIPMAADRIHATPAGYKMLAEKVFEELS